MTSLRWTTFTVVPKLRNFKSKPLVLAESAYAGLHATHVSLFEVLAESKLWSVRQLANALSAPITTISLALDRLEDQGLVKRVPSTQDQRLVSIELST